MVERQPADRANDSDSGRRRRAAAPSALQLPPGPWTTVVECLAAHFPAIPAEEWRGRMARGLVQDAGGRALGIGAAYRSGLAIRYFREVEQEAEIPFAESIVHADAELVVADKPPFLPVAPTGRWVRETLLTRLVLRLGQATLVPLHRLDRATAGLVLFSVNPATRAAYQALFRERRIEKVYEALAPPLPACSFPMLRRSRVVPGEPFFRMQEVAGPPNSLTGIDVLEPGPELWRYRLTAHTGRKHQLRVHMAALGAPIAGDRYYPTLQAALPDDYRRPLALLARSLRFEDPVTGQTRRFESRRTLAVES